MAKTTYTKPARPAGGTTYTFIKNRKTCVAYARAASLRGMKDEFADRWSYAMSRQFMTFFDKNVDQAWGDDFVRQSREDFLRGRPHRSARSKECYQRVWSALVATVEEAFIEYKGWQ